MVIHELGHLIAARRCNVPASELGLGMGPRLFGFRLADILFTVRAFPLGSFVMLDRNRLEEKSVPQQLFVHLGGIILNLIAGLATFGTVFSWMNLLLAAGNLLPLYQHDGWKCGVVMVRALLAKKSKPVEWTFTSSAGFLSLVIVYAIIRAFL